MSVLLSHSFPSFFIQGMCCEATEKKELFLGEVELEKCDWIDWIDGQS
jgi:hypothetical protein